MTHTFLSPTLLHPIVQCAVTQKRLERLKRVLLLSITLLSTALITGCLQQADEKNRCFSSSDCLDGFECENSFCVERTEMTPQSSSRSHSGSSEVENCGFPTVDNPLNFDVQAQLDCVQLNGNRVPSSGLEPGQCQFDSDCEIGRYCSAPFCQEGCLNNTHCPNGYECYVRMRRCEPTDSENGSGSNHSVFNDEDDNACSRMGGECRASDLDCTFDERVSIFDCHNQETCCMPR